MSSPRNRTLTLSESEKETLKQRLLYASDDFQARFHLNSTILGDCFQAFERLPRAFADLLILDPPYNLSKRFGSERFTKMPVDAYARWLKNLLVAARPLLKDTATIYICSEWAASSAVFEAASSVFFIQNRITWEREKGRGANLNWKNSSEDIWFCTVDKKNYVFNSSAVKIRRKVMAPYRDSSGPKDWDDTNGCRDTFASNLWTDITIPFWSMPENTDHPTQKSEKLIAKLILASSNPGDVVLDPFAGSGTSLVTAKKLGRQYIGIEADETYAMLSEKRLQIADTEPRIQGYTDGIFWERNSQPRV